MNKIKIGVQVTAKVCPTKVTVSGTFQGYELQDKEDPTSVCGKVFYVKDGMQLLDFVYVDSIKVCKGEDEDERIRKELIEYLTHRSEVTGFIDEDKDCKRWIAYLEKQKEQKPAEWKPQPESLEALMYAIEGKWEAIKPTSYLSRRLEDLYDGLVNTFNVDESFIAHENDYVSKSAEWSEEDKTHLCWIIECFDSWKYQVPEFADQYQSAIDWLKSLRPQPHWKPSKEQMEALNAVANEGVLLDLFNDLLKLL